MTGTDIGGRIRHAREQSGLTLEDVARLTRLSPSVLLAIERNDFASLPGGMYRKAYLRAVAAEVGVDPSQVAADYEAEYGRRPEPEAAVEGDLAVADKRVEELLSPPRRRVLTLSALTILVMVWFTFQPERRTAARPTVDRSVIQSPDMPGQADARSATSLQEIHDGGGRVTTAGTTAPELPIKVDLTTTGWCWIAADSDGERVLYGLIEPGRRVVVEGHDRISLRLGDAGSVRLSVNGGPDRTPGSEGQVVELEFTPDGLQTLNEAGTDADAGSLSRLRPPGA